MNPRSFLADFFSPRSGPRRSASLRLAVSQRFQPASACQEGPRAPKEKISPARSFVPAGALAGLLLALAPSAAHACAVCMGGDETTGGALNGAIFVMLGCIGSMLALITCVAVTIARR